MKGNTLQINIHFFRKINNSATLNIKLFWFLFLFLFIFFSFFYKVTSNWDPRTQACWPIPQSFHLNLQGTIKPPRPLTEGHNTAQYGVFYLIRIHPDMLSMASFIWFGSIQTKSKVCILIFSNTRHSHRMCSDVSFSASHLLHEGFFPFPYPVQHIMQIDMPS